VKTSPRLRASSPAQAYRIDRVQPHAALIDGERCYRSLGDLPQPQTVAGECILMFAKPTGVHKAHRWVWGVLGRLPA
jgi:predicted CoA-binding protein